MKTGLLLINLGTPASPAPSDVRPYLREFLSDPRVLDIPAWKRKLILEAFILPFRPRQSGEAYSKVWTAAGSPLMVHTEQLTRKVQLRLGQNVVVDFAMRYRQPAIGATLERMVERGVDRVVVFPLYPQYSSAATGSTLEEVFRSASRLWNVPYLHVVPPFYDHPAFLDACADLARDTVRRGDVERIYFSFHGLPERQVRKSDPSGRHCLAGEGCCDRIVEANRHCYRAQCYATARGLAERLELDDRLLRVCFQSRLGRDPWIRPYTDQMLVEDARAGVRRAVILSPAFVADCLETLEELGIRAVEDFKAAGGERLDVVPCLNAGDRWADAVMTLAREACPALGDAAAAGAASVRSAG